MSEDTTNGLNSSGNNNLPDATPAGGTTSPNAKDPDGNEISLNGKMWAGLFLIALTVFSALYLIGHWPDRLPAPDETIKPLYTYEWFNVRLANIDDTARIKRFRNIQTVAEKSGIVDTVKKKDIGDSSQNISGDSPGQTGADTPDHANNLQTDSKKEDVVVVPESDLMHIDTILLILVATAGFLGNMIHIATSFTTFIGNGQYKKSWGLWYIVKPFTAAALAIAIYFVFRGGFLNMSDESTNINLYGLMTVSLLAGLFTDRTTIKLKEVFEVLLRPKEDRQNPLTETKPTITDVIFQPLEVAKPAVITPVGLNLDKKNTIKVEGQIIPNATAQSTGLTFTYTLSEDQKDKESLKLQAFDETGKEIQVPKQLAVAKVAAPLPANNENAKQGVQEEASDELLNQAEFGDADAAESLEDINKPQE